jgi:predicted DNA binding protein
MSVIAEFRLASEELPLNEALNAAPDMILDVEQTMAEDPERPVLFVWARGGDFEQFERALANETAIAEYEVMERLTRERLYRIQISSTSDVGFYRFDVEVGTSRLDVTATHEGVEVRMRFPDQHALKEYFDRCRDQGMAVSLRRLYQHEASNPTDNQYGLSAKQRETLELAYREGFFQIPRETSLADVAAALDISEQAASERIRRATAALIRTTLAPDDLEE